ncbi:transcriptional regulator family: Fungal Specific TF [Paecilomyces variotii]|nr:transcriptional regulator family: Fungal Specific TF [Paecilomyces variotii]KAJ9240083.1 transcriptional regulator family: Fungal Specific TF [Paecilomyces variotii]KAJ9253089.1 transcriptional regulator family: Fungal Specific TF [Paecilomyces variotii]
MRVENSIVARAPRSSGRNVTHSRRGCLTCKKRKLRCPENKPICSRCWDDNKTCRYEVQLQWEDESRQRGVKHGRATRTLAPLSTQSWVEAPMKGKVEHFINTTVHDLEDEVAISLFPFRHSDTILRRASSPSIIIEPALFPTLRASQDGQFFDFYLQRVCENMTLVDYRYNAFRQIILPLSLNDDLVMETVLALGALALSATGQENIYTVALRHKHRSIRILRQKISNIETAVNDYNLIAILMLCVFDISDNCQTSWSTHLSAAIDLMRLQTDKHKIPAISPAVSEFVSRYFLVRDALGRSACGKRAKIKELPSSQSDEIDPSIGCSYELIHIISSITDASREITISNTSLMESSDWLKKTNNIDHQLRSLAQRLPPSFSQNPTTASPSEALSPSDILLRTSAFIHTAARLYFIATLRPLECSTAQTQHLLTSAIECIRPLSPTYLRSAHLWPLFVAAVHATEDEDRVFFLDQFSVLGRHEFSIVAAGSIARVRDIVETVWKRRDLVEPSSHVSETRVRSDWARYVQPMSDQLSLG